MNMTLKKTLKTFCSLVFCQLLISNSFQIAEAQSAAEINDVENAKPDVDLVPEPPVKNTPVPVEPVPEVTPTVAPAAPTPKVTPTAVPFPGPIPKSNSKVTETPPPDYHAATPTDIKDRLSLGATLGLGWGKSSQKNDSTDRLAAQVYVNYLLLNGAKEQKTEGMAWLGEFNYLTLTGVNAKFDETFSAQMYSLGAGIQFPFATQSPSVDVSSLKLGASERMKFQALLLIGLSQRNAKALATGLNIKTKFGASVGLETRYLYRVWNKIDLLAGIGARTVSYTWIDAKLGVQYSF